MSNDTETSEVGHYPEQCPVCNREVLDEHFEKVDGQLLEFRVCDADTGQRHQWREDGAVWSARDGAWVDREEFDPVWDTESVGDDPAYYEVLSDGGASQ